MKKAADDYDILQEKQLWLYNLWSKFKHKLSCALKLYANCVTIKILKNMT